MLAITTEPSGLPPPAGLVAFLFHLRYDVLTASALDEIERRVAVTDTLAALRAIDPHTFAAAEALAERLVNMEHDEPGGGGDRADEQGQEDETP